MLYRQLAGYNCISPTGESPCVKEGKQRVVVDPPNNIVSTVSSSASPEHTAGRTIAILMCLCVLVCIINRMQPCEAVFALWLPCSDLFCPVEEHLQNFSYRITRKLVDQDQILLVFSCS